LVITADSTFEGVSVLDFKFGKEIFSIPLFVKKINKYTFYYTPDKPHKSINLFGVSTHGTDKNT